MNFTAKRKPKAPTVALTSMLDVIFLLLCFFVTASVYSQWESEISIQLPNARTGEDPDRLPGEIIANIAKDGTVRVNGAELTLDDLQECVDECPRARQTRRLLQLPRDCLLRKQQTRVLRQQRGLRPRA